MHATAAAELSDEFFRSGQKNPAQFQPVMADKMARFSTVDDSGNLTKLQLGVEEVKGNMKQSIGAAVLPLPERVAAAAALAACARLLTPHTPYSLLWPRC